MNTKTLQNIKKLLPSIGKERMPTFNALYFNDEAMRAGNNTECLEIQYKGGLNYVIKYNEYKDLQKVFQEGENLEQKIFEASKSKEDYKLLDNVPDYQNLSQHDFKLIINLGREPISDTLEEFITALETCFCLWGNDTRPTLQNVIYRADLNVFCATDIYRLMIYKPKKHYTAKTNFFIPPNVRTFILSQKPKDFERIQLSEAEIREDYEGENCGGANKPFTIQKWEFEINGTAWTFYTKKDFGQYPLFEKILFPDLSLLYKQDFDLDKNLEGLKLAIINKGEEINHGYKVQNTNDTVNAEYLLDLKGIQGKGKTDVYSLYNDPMTANKPLVFESQDQSFQYYLMPLKS